MPKSHYLPVDDDGKEAWLTNFANKLAIHASAVGVTAAEVTSVQDDAAFFSYVLNAQKHYSNTAQQWTAYKTQARNGDGAGLGAMPVAPTLGAPPTAVAPGIFRRIGNLIARVKKHPGYTEAIGQDLDIIGAEQAVDLNTIKPILNLELQAGHPNILWKKQGMGGLEIHVDRGSGAFSFLALDTEPDYLDTAPLPAPGQTALWKYKAIYRLHDEQVGQWSDVASMVVGG
jgi:hypothetical protein